MRANREKKRVKGEWRDQRKRGEDDERKERM